MLKMLKIIKLAAFTIAALFMLAQLLAEGAWSAAEEKEKPGRLTIKFD